MVVTELRNAVVDTIEFIIPPIVKIAIILVVADYITKGFFTLYLSGTLSNEFKSINIDRVKAAIDGLYLSGVIPIVAILLLITLAYIVNRITNFIGSIVPIYYHAISTLKIKYFVVDIWLYFSEISTVEELNNKIMQLYLLAQAAKSALPFDQMKWQEEARMKLFEKINFFKFLLIWSIFCYWFTIENLSIPLQSNRLWLTIIVLIIVVVALYFQVANKEIDIEVTRLIIVSNFLKSDPAYALKRNTSTDVRKELEIKFDLINKHTEKWWWLSVGYRTDWIMMFKYYRFRLPFYMDYERWKQKRRIDNEKY